MKPPRKSDYVFGNPVSVLVLLGITIFAGYQWWIGAASPVMPLLAFLGTGYAFGAGDRLQKYRDWKREWDAMDGKRPGINFSFNSRTARVLIAIPVILFFLFIAFAAPDSPEISLARVLLTLAVLVVIAGPLFQRLFHTRAKEKVALRDMPVTQCLRPPQQSPTVQQAFSALPEYCIALFQDH